MRRAARAQRILVPHPYARSQAQAEHERHPGGAPPAPLAGRNDEGGGLGHRHSGVRGVTAGG
ncbi:hypothetical protein D555_2051 [Bordetella holmesii 35009]|nr:hypothetical protein D555_2051 [Bordetella holmesii 35009]